MRSYHDVLGLYKVHPEAKSLGPDGKPCGRATAGLLQRRPVSVESVIGIGKEANKLEAVQSGLVHNPTEVLNMFRRPADDSWRLVIVPVLKLIPAKRLAEATGLAVSTVKSARNGHSLPRQANRDALLRAAGELAPKTLAKQTASAHDDPVTSRRLLT